MSDEPFSEARVTKDPTEDAERQRLLEEVSAVVAAVRARPARDLRVLRVRVDRERIVREVVDTETGEILVLVERF